MSIDRRIVDMRFDNKQFEQGVKETNDSLAKLNDSLKLEGAAKGLTDVSKASKGFDVSGITEGVGLLESRFTTMGIIGMEAIKNLTNSAINAGKNIVKNFIDPIFSGGKRRAVNLEQAEFQFRGLGMDVEKTMASANEAVLGTAYGLDSAAKAAGQFGATGMEAGEEMTKALRGISGVAAMTGRDYDDVARIFTTVSGNGRLMGMQLTQLGSYGINAAATMAKAFNKTEAEVRAMASNGQISFEMFYQAMDGAFGEHATKANETFNGSLSNMKAALSRLGASFYVPGMNAMIPIFNALQPLINGIHASIKPLIDRFTKFSEVTSVNVVNALNSLGFNKTAEDIKPLSKGLSDLMRMFKGLWAVIEIGWSFVKAFGYALSDTIGYLSPAGSGVMDLVGHMSDLIMKFRDFIIESDTFNKIFVVIGNVLRPIGSLLNIIVKGLVSLVEKIRDTIKPFDKVKAAAGDATYAMKPFNKMVRLLADAFQYLSNKVKAVIGGIEPVFSTIISVIGTGLTVIKDFLKQFSFEGGLGKSIDLVNAGLFASILIGIRAFIKKLNNISIGTGFLDGIRTIFNGLSETLQSFQQSLNAKTLQTLAIAISLLVASIVVLSTIDTGKLASATTALGLIFAELLGAMYILQQITKTKGFNGITKIAGSMILLSTAVLILSGAVKTLSSLSLDELKTGLLGVGALLAMLTATAKLMQNTSASTIKGAAALVIMASAVRVLTKAVETLGNMDPEKVGQGLAGVATLLLSLALFSKIQGANAAGIGQGVGLMATAVAINILSKSVQTFGDMPINNIIKGLGAMGVLLVELALFTRLSGGSAKMILTATGLTILGGALMIFTNVLENLGDMDTTELATGLKGLAQGMTVITAALRAMPKNMIATSLGLLAVSASLTILSKVIDTLGQMETGVMVQGVIGLIAILAPLSIALNMMTGTLAGAAAMIVAAGALAILAPVLTVLGNMSLGEIAKGLLSISGMFGVLFIAGIALGPLLPVLLGLAGVMTLLGVATLAAGAGVLAISAGITALAVAGTAGAAGMKAAAGILISLIPYTLTQFGLGLVEFVKVIGESASAFVGAFTQILTAIFDGMIKLVPKGVEALTVLLDALLNLVLEFVPKLFDAGLELMIHMLSAIASKLPEIVKSAVDIVVAFLTSFGEQLPRIIDAGWKLVISLVNGIADALRDNDESLREAGWNLVTAIIEAATGAVKDIWDTGVKLVSDFLGGIWSKFKSLFTGGKDAGKKAVTGMEDGSAGTRSIGQRMMEGFKGGISSMASSLGQTAKNVVSGAVNGVKGFLGIRSPSRLFAEIGQFSGMGMVEGLKSTAKSVATSAKDVGAGAIDAMRNAMDGAAEILENDMTLNPTITPVVDLTSLDDMDRRLATSKELNVDSTINQASQIAHERRRAIFDAPNGVSSTDNSQNYNGPLIKVESMTVRNDSDIEKVAEQLYSLTLKRGRA